jgi:hypothetical protein
MWKVVKSRVGDAGVIIATYGLRHIARVTVAAAFYSWPPMETPGSSGRRLSANHRTHAQ